MTERKNKHQRYDAKRLKKPMINAIRDVPQAVVDKLDRLAKNDGSKKNAIIKAIEDRYEKVSK